MIVTIIVSIVVVCLLGGICCQFIVIPTVRADNTERLERLIESHGGFLGSKWCLYGLSLQGYYDRKQIGAYSSSLYIMVERLPMVAVDSFVYRPSDGKCEMMHLPTGTYVYLYTREHLGIQEDSVYPLRTTHHGLNLPYTQITFDSSSESVLLEEYLRISKYNPPGEHRV